MKANEKKALLLLKTLEKVGAMALTGKQRVEILCLFDLGHIGGRKVTNYPCGSVEYFHGVKMSEVCLSLENNDGRIDPITRIQLYLITYRYVAHNKEKLVFTYLSNK